MLPGSGGEQQVQMDKPGPALTELLKGELG
jgi:hypothetical protein